MKERKSDRFETIRCLSVVRITKAHAHKLCEKKKKKKNNLISIEIIMTTKEEDEDALLYGDVGDSDD